MSEAVSLGAAVAPAPQSTGAVRRRIGLAALTAVLAVALVGVASPSPAQASLRHYRTPSLAALGVHRGSQAAKLYQLATRQIGKRYARGTSGMRTFDCEGFVYRMYKVAGLAGKIGGRRRTGPSWFHYFRARGMASRRAARLGDVVVWNNGHVGLLLGHGWTLDATPQRGVSVHKVKTVKWHDGILSPVAYLHVSITR